MPSRNRPHFALHDLIFMIIGLLPTVALMLFRAWSLDAERGAFTDCVGCFIWPAISSDLWLLAFLGALLAAVSLHPKAWTRALCVLFGGAAVLIFAVDILITQILHHRLHLTDILNYGDDTHAQVDLLLPFLSTMKGKALVVSSLLAITLFAIASLRLSFRPGTDNKTRWHPFRRATFPFVFTLSISALAWSSQGIYYLDLDYFENVFLINVQDTSLHQHSSERLAQLHALPEPPRVCSQGTNRQASVVLVVLESWSLYHSKLFSGLGDYTPKLDALAKENTWFPEYYSNGFTTETGLIALLDGQVPIPTHRAMGVLAFDKPDQDVHRALAARGYFTAFFTTGTLTFADRAAWLKKIGIQYAEGDEQPSYAGLPRGPFDAASDRALVDRFLSWYDHERPNQPFMATVLTVGTHPPFVDTDDSDPVEPGERAAFARVDREIARLVEGLKRRGFLKEGIVMVVGDHRAMTPMTAKEMTKYGENGLARVPAMLIGATGLQAGPVQGVFQQTDLLPSLERMIQDKVCVNDWQGIMFPGPPKPAKIVIYSHSAIRDELRVLIKGSTYRIKLDGDDTRWLGPVPEEGDAILREVMRQRVSHDTW